MDPIGIGGRGRSASATASRPTKQREYLLGSCGLSLKMDGGLDKTTAVSYVTCMEDGKNEANPHGRGATYAVPSSTTHHEQGGTVSTSAITTCPDDYYRLAAS